MEYKTAQECYEQVVGNRYQYLDRARQCSKLTLPYVMPEEGFGAHSRLDTPFQGVGARGANNLASKLLLALLPPNAPFFRLNVDTYALKQDGAPDEIVTEIETSLQKMEEGVMEEISRETYRTVLHEVLKHLIICGNALVYLPDEGGMRVFHLDRYVVQRDPMGNPISMATKETISYAVLSDEMKQAIGTTGEMPTDNCDLYTAVKLIDNKWHVWQDINGVRVPDSEGTYAKDKCPFIPLRFCRIDGESYGRGYIEEYLGDLQSLEKLTQAIVEGSAASAKVLFLVNPNGTTNARTLAESPNGAIVSGNVQDVTVLQVNKQADLRVAQETIAAIKDRLSHAFLLTSNTVRNAERVTAEEIRMLGQELESALGGLYSLLSTELQLPMVTRLMDVMGKKKTLPKLPKDIVKPVIITGVEALGRGNDLQKLDLFLGGVAQMFGPEVMQQYVMPSEYFARRATALGIKIEGLIKPQEQLQQEQAQAQQQAQQQQMIEKLGPAGIKAMSDQAKQTPSEEQ